MRSKEAGALIAPCSAREDANTATSSPRNPQVEDQSKPLRGSLIKAAVVFFASYVILFAGMNLRPNIYDEGIVLTDAMRVVAGQIPHQDFYCNYGPGQFYVIAGLFKIFGQSVLVERLYDLFIKALIAAFVYLLASRYCRKSIANYTTIATVLCFFVLNETMGSTLVPVSLLNLLACVLVLPVFSRALSIKRSLAAGAVAGVAVLFRYDTGIALFGVEVCLIALAVFLRTAGITDRLRAFASAIWPILVGSGTVTLSALAYYLSRASLQPFVFGILIYPSKYYHRARNLPFPPIKLKQMDNLAIYLPIAIIGLSFYVAYAYKSQRRNEDVSGFENKSSAQAWRGFLITFGLLAFVMYLKGLVRVHIVHMYLSILPSILLLASLFQNRKSLARPFQIAIKSIVWVSVFAVAFADLREVRVLFKQHASIPENAWLAYRGHLPQTQAVWCSIKSPSTIGLCFFPDSDHMQAIEFIASHTRPDQKLFVGQTRYDIIFANDIYTYFATQRLPATKWAHFDPLLQNTYKVQAEMIAELAASAPPYIEADSEFDKVHEPNDSWKSSGVTVVDDYIHSKYQRVQTFGEISVWKRTQAP